jgi:hypothetical protein
MGTVAIAVVASLVAAPFFLGWKTEEPVRILKNEYPTRLSVAASDSVGENAFELGLVVNKEFVRVKVGFRFLYGHNLTKSKDAKVNATLARILTLQRIVPSESQAVRTGFVTYNGTRASYTLYDFSASPAVPPGSNVSTFLMVGVGPEVLACFYGVADLFPERSAGSLIEATLTRSGNRTHYSRQALGAAQALPIASLPRSPFTFEGVSRGETIEISFRSDAFFARPQGGGAVQVMEVDCDGAQEALILNFIG